MKIWISWLLARYFSWRHPKLGEFEVDLLVKGRLFKLYQIRFFFADYVLRKPYKVVACDSEFGVELKFYVPFAYWHHLNGTLLRTESSRGTKSLYWFSSRHQEKDLLRRYSVSPDVPNSEDHNFQYSLGKWSTVPYAGIFRASSLPQFKEPILIISNKYTTEWNRPPVNFLSLENLERILPILLEKYRVIYNRPTGNEIQADASSNFVEYEDKNRIRETFPEVTLAEDLYSAYPGLFSDFNEFQLALYSRCSRFISVQGGNSVLASYFGGTNIVFVREGRELIFDEYPNFYPRLSGAKIILTRTESELFAAVREQFLENEDSQ